MSKNSEITKSNKVKIILITALILIVSIAGISYAYFTVNVTGNDTASSMNVTTAILQLVYNDVQIVSGEGTIPGWSDTKTLTVTNTGTAEVDYIIKFRELENTIINGELVLSATCSASSGTCDALPERAVHAAATEITNAYMYGPISIAPGVTQTYTLTVEFKETGSNQNYNQNKYFSGTLNIGDGTATPESCFTTSGEYAGNHNLNSITGYDISCGTDVIIPKTIDDKPVAKVGNSSFAEKGLTSVVIPDGIVAIGNSTFSGNQLTSVVIPSSVTIIEKEAFFANQLTSVVIPEGVTAIGQSAFENNQLTSVVIPNSVTTIGNSAFSTNQLTLAEIPNSITSIGVYLFQNNQLTSVIIPYGVITIGASAFKDNQLTSVVIPNSVTTIGGDAFRNNQLVSVVIPNSVTTLGNRVFHTNQLTSITIPSSVTSIGSQVFVNNQLTSVVIPSSVTAIGDGVFLSNSLVMVEIEGKTSSSDFETYGDGIWGWKSGINNICTKDNTSNVTNGCILWEGSDQLVSDGFVYTISGNEATITRYLGTDANLRIPSTLDGKTVTAIGNHAFRESGIASLVIPDTVTSIGTYAFYKNSISALTLGTGLQTIGDDAFHENQISTVIFPNGLVSIGVRAFRLNNFSTTLTIPSSVTTLGQYAFGKGNALRSVTIEGKSSSSEFSVYNSPFDWASDVTCTKNNTSYNANGCINWLGSGS